MKVKKWISYDEANGYNEAPCGGIGGFFQDSMRFNDYITTFKKKAYPYILAIQDSIVKNKIKLTGAEHQTCDNAVPLFDDNTVATYSYRAWGDLMAAIWSEEEDKDYMYMDFYM